MSYTVPCSACQEGIDHDGNHCRLYPVRYNHVKNPDPKAYPTCWLCPDCWNKLIQKVRITGLDELNAHTPIAHRECNYCGSFNGEQFYVGCDTYGVRTSLYDIRNMPHETAHGKLVFCSDFWMSIQMSLIPIETLMSQDHISIKTLMSTQNTFAISDGLQK